MDFRDMYYNIAQYQITLGHTPKTHNEGIEYARMMCLGLFQEVAELTDSFPWKPWRPVCDQTMNYKNLKVEIVDCLFFLVGIARAFAISPEELQDELTCKLEENYARIKSGYNHTNGLKGTEEPVKPADEFEF